MIIAVDTGGTKTFVAKFTKQGEKTEPIRFPTPKNQEEYIKRLLRTIDSITEKDEVIDGVVVAIPGIVNDGVALWCNHLGWKNFDIKSRLEEYFEDIPVLVENDANLGGLGEIRKLEKIPKTGLYVTISTGIGTGIIVNGHIDEGLSRSEGGRMPIEYNGQLLEWEQFAAGSAIFRDFGKYAADIDSPEDWEIIADRISRGFLAIIPLIQPDLIVIGGSIGTHFHKYEQHLEHLLSIKLPEHIPCPIFITPKEAEQAVINGCYYYAVDQIYS